MKNIRIDWSDFIMEVISVFLGVMAVILVNNWSENRQNHKQEQILYQSLEADLESEIMEMEIILNQTLILDSLFSVYVPAVMSKQADTEGLFRFLTRLANFSSYQSKHTTYEMLTASNSLHAISDLVFLKEIITHYSQEAHVQQIDNRYAQFLTDQYEPFAVQHLSFADYFNPSDPKTNISNLYDTHTFANLLIGLQKFNTDRRNVYWYFKDQKVELLEKVQSKTVQND